MIPLVLAAMFLGLVTTASGQRRGLPSSPSGYGGILYPGASHAPSMPANGAGWHNLFGRRLSAARPRPATPGGIVVIPFPVYYSGNLDGESGTSLPSDENPAQASTNLPAQPSTNLDDRPPVVINRNLASPMGDPRLANHYPAAGRESGPPVCQNAANSCASADQGASNRVDHDGKPTIYLIAFKDHSIVQALGYWTEGTMLHYVSVEYAFNHASISLIDSDVSRRLNHERGIEFTGLE
jgi:hypothetical protein